MKNTIFILAKLQAVSPPELFASIIGAHFINTYKHIHVAHVSVITHRWTRITINGKPHPHSFLRDGGETRNVEVNVIEGKGIDIKSSISGLMVLKSTNSQFHGFIRDEFTTLPETSDRILSTEVDASWRWPLFASLDLVKSEIPKFDASWEAAREITLNTFAGDNSLSVQNTMYKMAEKILAAQPLLTSVDYSLPNKHYLELGISPCHLLPRC
jgi:urate oxidase